MNNNHKKPIVINKVFILNVKTSRPMNIFIVEYFKLNIL